MTHIGSEQIQAQLDKILATKGFVGASRLSQFLRYVIDQYVNDNRDQIKQYTIAVEALGLSDDFDPQKNPIVRTYAQRLRRALRDYYSSKGEHDPIRIDIPKGSYSPVITRNNNKILVHDLVSGIVTSRPLANINEIAVQDGPSVAVLPMEYLGNDPDFSYFASGISEEIVIGLTRFQEFIVVGPLNREIISREQLGPRAIGQKYNARFLLDGTVRLRNQSLKLTTKLTDTRDGRKLWGQTHDHHIESSSIEQVEQEIVSQIVATIADSFGVIPRTIAKEVLSHQQDSLSKYEAILRFHHHVRSLTETSLAEATLALEEVVQQDPEHDLALALLGDLAATTYWLGYTDSQYGLGRATELGKRALALNPNSQPAHMTMAIVYYLRFQKEQCLKHIDRALNLNPNNANYLANAALLLAGIGQGEDSIALIDKAMRWNPHHPGWYQFVPFQFHYYRGNYQNALAYANGFNTPEYFWDPLIQASVLGQLGNYEEAGNAVDELLALVPDFETRGRSLIHRMVYLEGNTKMLIEGLAKAGLGVV